MNLLRGGLGRRILGWFAVLSLVPLVVTNTVGYLISVDIIESQTERYLNGLTEDEARHLAGEISRQRRALVSTANAHFGQSPTLRQLTETPTGGNFQSELTRRVENELAILLLDLRPSEKLLLIDEAGRVLVSTGPEESGEAWTVDGVQEWRSGRIVIHHPAVDSGEDVPDAVPHRHGSGTAEHTHADPDSGGFRYSVAAPVQLGPNSDRVFLVGTVNFDELQDFLQIPPHPAGTVHSYLIDTDGMPLLVTHRHGEVNYSQPLPRPVVEAPDGVVVQYDNLENEGVFGTKSGITGTEWSYVSEVSRAGALGQLRSLALYAVSFESAFVLLLLLVSWLVARQITAPVTRLAKAAERLGSGELGVEVAIQREDELGALGRTFNQMSAELKASAERIEELYEQDMQRAGQLATVGEMASGIAHEIKNPIVGTLSGLKLLERELGPDASPRAREIMRQIESQLSKMQLTIRDLLSYARPKEPRLVTARPSQIAGRILPLIETQAHAAGIRIETDFDERDPPILVDPDLMIQALMNLALNAIQAMDEGGLLRITTAQRNNDALISVSDIGPGIEEDRLEGIFRPFVTSKHQGTGLGLTITRSIVERHEGRLEVDSQVGRGTTFSIVLPLNDATDLG